MRAQGAWTWGRSDSDLLDGSDWWYRCNFSDPGGGPWLLRFGGLATVADVWLNGDHVLRSDDMFVSHEVVIEQLRADGNELCIRFASLHELLRTRRPRPRWKSRLVRHQNLRWIRTTLLGRMDGWAAWAAPVGPWRDIALVPLANSVRLVESTIDARCVGNDGHVKVRAVLQPFGTTVAEGRLRVGDAVAALDLSDEGSHVVVTATATLPDVDRWWPHTHGPQPRYAVTLEIGDQKIALRDIGFRTVELNRSDDGFQFVLNGTPIFCRGALWVPPDVVSLNATRAQLRASLELLRNTGMNMLRIGGYGTYEGDDFWDLCDELGILVWQDCMLASFDPPEDDEFVTGLEHELTKVFTSLQGRPALALVCGSSETYQQAAMFGLDLESWRSKVLDDVIPAVVARSLPETPYVASSPSGGVLPFDPSVGVAHYFGVGAYERPLSDARLSGVRFAAECLAFANPPEPETIDEVFGSSVVVGHSAAWKATVARDSGTSWDFEDIRDSYVERLFGVDARAARYAESDWALDLGRAAVAEAMTAVMAEWRRPGSRCAGGLVLSWQDLWPGAGWGIVDSLGRPKAPAYALARTLAPCAVFTTDDGLSGLHIHVVNDRPSSVAGRLQLAAFTDEGVRVEFAEDTIEVPARGSYTTSAAEILGGFRDLTRAYRFGPPAHDAVIVSLVANDGDIAAPAFYFPLGPSRPRRSDLGLVASARRHDDAWELTITTELLAQWVAIRVPGYRPSDSWFHLAPGASKTVTLRSSDPDGVPRGDVRALNARSPISITRQAD
jgi:beta-mannosidase